MPCNFSSPCLFMSVPTHSLSHSLSLSLSLSLARSLARSLSLSLSFSFSLSLSLSLALSRSLSLSLALSRSLSLSLCLSYSLPLCLSASLVLACFCLRARYLNINSPLLPSPLHLFGAASSGLASLRVAHARKTKKISGPSLCTLLRSQAECRCPSHSHQHLDNMKIVTHAWLETLSPYVPTGPRMHNVGLHDNKQTNALKPFQLKQESTINQITFPEVLRVTKLSDTRFQ